MTKQEAVERIKAIHCWKFNDDTECEIYIENDGFCDDCEYLIAIECIEKQIPKEAKWKVQGNGWNDWIVYTCPVCGTEIRDAHVCPKCYQVIKSYKESDNND